MTDFVHLVGAERVDTAARNIWEAAQQMTFAASSMQMALERHQNFLDSWLVSFQEALDKHKEKTP